MSDSSLSPAGVSAANDPSRVAVQAAAPREKSHALRADRARASSPETVPEAVAPEPPRETEAPVRDAVEAAPAPSPEAVPAREEQASKTPRKLSRSASAARVKRSASALMLDLEAVAHVEGLTEEVAMLRASIRELAHPRGDLSEHVKILAELRHQVEALCSTLKAQQALESREGGPADLNQTLDDLGDRLGVSR